MLRIPQGREGNSDQTAIPLRGIYSLTPMLMSLINVVMAQIPIATEVAESFV
jgi:hypothetical protein